VRVCAARLRLDALGVCRAPVLTGSGFTVDTGTLSGTVAPGDSTQFTITFAPTAPGNVSAQVTFTHDGQGPSPFSLTVQGLGSTTPQPDPTGPGADGSPAGGGGCAANSTGAGMLALLLAAGLMVAMRRRPKPRPAEGRDIDFI